MSATGPVKTKPHHAERQEPAASMPTLPAAVVASSPPSLELETATLPTAPESTLDNLFARLSAQESSQSAPSVTPSWPQRPKASNFYFGEGSGPQDQSSEQEPDMTRAKGASSMSVSPSRIAPAVDKTEENTKLIKKDAMKDAAHVHGLSQAGAEELYLRKAAEFLEALPHGNRVPIDTIKAVSKKLVRKHTSEISLSGGEVEKLKARYALAMVNYINHSCKKAAKPMISNMAKKMLVDADGNFLCLCAKLVADEYIALENIDEMTGLCKMILDALPIAEVASTATTGTTAAGFQSSNT
ncbi:hypothetical protein ACEQ8H_002829 [Pleosporales sp. CAS-2024a]